jgi:hypothetical protein
MTLTDGVARVDIAVTEVAAPTPRIRRVVMSV